MATIATHWVTASRFRSTFLVMGGTNFGGSPLHPPADQSDRRHRRALATGDHAPGRAVQLAVGAFPARLGGTAAGLFGAGGADRGRDRSGRPYVGRGDCRPQGSGLPDPVRVLTGGLSGGRAGRERPRLRAVIGGELLVGDQISTPERSGARTAVRWQGAVGSQLKQAIDGT